MRSSETRAEDVARELLTIRGWNVASPSRGGNLLWKNEYRDYPHLAAALAGRGKKGKGGDGYPDFLVVDQATMQPLIVGETKARDDEIKVAIDEADLYGDAFADGGLNVLAAGIAGDDKSNIEVRVNKRDRREWRPVEYRSNPIQWIPTPEETSLLLTDLRLFELQPRVPSNEILAERGEELNRILRECKISDPHRPAITGAIMLALVQSKGAIRMDVEHILPDINAECKKAFIKAGKPEIAESIFVPQQNDKLAAQAGYICHILRLLNITTLTTEHDYLGQLYETFFRFTGGNTIGQVFTPRHITRFITNMVDIGRGDLVIDPTCGTGGFLIAALHRMMAGKNFTHKQISDLVKDHLIGFETDPITAALCVANMILRGDGTTGIVKDDCFTSRKFPIGKASIAVGNPPFPHNTKTDDPPEKYVDRALSALSARGVLAMIVPTSQLVKGKKKSWRIKTLKNNSLQAVITLPSELFLPYATYNTSIIILKKGVPHSATTQTFFCRVQNDGFRIKKNVRIEQPGEELTQAVSCYHTRTSIPGFCTVAKLHGTGWHPGEYIKAAPHTTQELKKEISGLIRSLVGFHAHFAPHLAYFKSVLDDGDLKPRPVAEIFPKRTGRHGVDDSTCIGGLSGKWIDRLRERQPMRELILDMDSSVSETYGEQEGTAYNGHFGCTCYHPLFCFNQFGDVEQSLLREGNVHSAKDWRAVLEPVMARYQGRNLRRYFRADAAFANPEIYEYLEAEGFEYAIRLPANDALLRDIEPLLTRPVGRPSNVPVVWYAGFLYQAKSWNRARRVVAKVEWHNGELFPRVGFIVTNLVRPPKRVVRFYNQRGTAEQWIKEGKNAVKWTRLSCHDFADNQVRLHLFVLAYNLGNFLRQAVLPKTVRHWTLTTLREKLIKVGAKVVRHSRKIVFQMAEVAVPRELFRAILEGIGRLRLAVASSG